MLKTLSLGLALLSAGAVDSGVQECFVLVVLVAPFSFSSHDYLFFGDWPSGQPCLDLASR